MDDDGNIWRWSAHLLIVIALVGSLSTTAIFARDGRDPDRTDRATEQADRDVSRAAERADRDQARYLEERAKIMDEAAKDPQRAAEEMAKLEEDRQEDLQKATEDAAKDATDAAEDAAKDAAEAAEEATENHGMSGSSEGMRGVGQSENPDHDSRGYPVRRGEIIALDLSAGGLREAQAKGYRVVAREELPSLGGSLTRLAVPAPIEPEAAIDALQAIEPQATFDYTHYYGLQVSPSGAAISSRAGKLPHKTGSFSVGMIDTAVAAHGTLDGTALTRKDFSSGKAGVPIEHGTAVASILASDGARSLYVANIFRGGTASPFTSAEAIASALEWMASNRIPVVNMSLSGPRNAILDKLIERTSERGTVIVAAAGNSGPTAPPAYPAALPSVVAVTAVDAKMRVYRYANQGKYLDVASRGVNEPAAKASGGTALFSGTSFATPHVAAWLARCMQNTRGGSCSQQLVTSAKDLGAPGHDAIYGYGFVIEHD